MDFVARPWVRVADYWEAHWTLTENLKVAMDGNGLTIAFPQRAIYVHTAAV